MLPANQEHLLTRMGYGSFSKTAPGYKLCLSAAKDRTLTQVDSCTLDIRLVLVLLQACPQTGSVEISNHPTRQRAEPDNAVQQQTVSHSGPTQVAILPPAMSHQTTTQQTAGRQHSVLQTAAVWQVDCTGSVLQQCVLKQQQELVVVRHGSLVTLMPCLYHV